MNLSKKLKFIILKLAALSEEGWEENEPPQHENYCSSCIFLGRYQTPEDSYDLYVCRG